MFHFPEQKKAFKHIIISKNYHKFLLTIYWIPTHNIDNHYPVSFVEPSMVLKLYIQWLTGEIFLQCFSVPTHLSWFDKIVFEY